MNKAIDRAMLTNALSSVVLPPSRSFPLLKTVALLTHDAMFFSPEVSRNALYRVLCSACCSVSATSCSVNSGATAFGAARVVNHYACCLLLFIQIQFNYITYLLCRQQCRKNAHGGWMLPPDIHPASLGYISCRMIKKPYYQN